MQQSLTSPYWAQPAIDNQVKTTMPISGHLGFEIDIPYKAPVSTPMYFGENPVVGRRELVTRPDGEYYAVGGIVPMLTEKIPLVDLQDPAYSFSRAQHTFHI